MSNLHVKILTGAKKSIASGAYYFVCDAIRLGLEDERGSLDTPMVSAKQDILDDIAASLAPHTVVGWWLVATHPEFNSIGSMPEYRLAWIDSLIEYWRDK